MNRYEEMGEEYLIIANALDEELRRIMHDFEEDFVMSDKPFCERDLDNFKRVAMVRDKYLMKEREARAKSWEEYRKEKEA